VARALLKARLGDVVTLGTPGRRSGAGDRGRELFAHRLTDWRKRRMSMLQEFKSFAMKGNVVDLAVGVIIGVAFGKIVASLVGDVIMPMLGVLIGGINFSGPRVRSARRPSYGKFLQACVDFLIIAWAIFVAVKLINRLRREERAEPAAPAAPPPRQEVLLEEIRDLLKKA
jgi:large conductance mechanosensitive channel